MLWLEEPRVTVLPVRTIYPSDKAIGFQPVQDNRIDRVRVSPDLQIDWPQRTEEPVSVPVRDVVTGDPLESWRTALKGDRSRSYLLRSADA